MKKSKTDRGAKNGAPSKTVKKGEHHTAKAKEARTLSKLDNEKSRLDARICKLIDQGYSPASIAKRLGITQRRIETAVQAETRSR